MYEIQGDIYEIGADGQPVPVTHNSRFMLPPRGTLPMPPPMQNAPMVLRKREPDQSRLFPVGVNSVGNVANGATAITNSNPQNIFKPRRYVIPVTVAPDFVINDIRIGTLSQLASNDTLPGEIFLPDAMYTDLDFDTNQISQNLTVSVTNIGAAPKTFRSAFFGYVAR